MFLFINDAVGFMKSYDVNFDSFYGRRVMEPRGFRVSVYLLRLFNPEKGQSFEAVWWSRKSGKFIFSGLLFLYN